MIIELGLASETTKGLPTGTQPEISQATQLPCNAPASFNFTTVVIPGCRV